MDARSLPNNPSSSARSPTRSNPFITRAIRPGAIPFQFPPGIDPSSLIGAWRRRNFAPAAIIGPHGSGKSTLLKTLQPFLQSQFETVQSHAFHASNSEEPSRAEAIRSAIDADALVIDGYEQCTAWQRWRLQRAARKHGTALLVTAHRPLWGMHSLITMQPTEAMVMRLVDRLLRDGLGMDEADAFQQRCYRHIASRWPMMRGNVRELLFELYDLDPSHRAGTHPAPLRST
jgi:hypothetical protein